MQATAKRAAKAKGKNKKTAQGAAPSSLNLAGLIAAAKAKAKTAKPSPSKA